jgi:ankyrin repeat and fibronectin type-III domain-containing protein 1
VNGSNSVLIKILQPIENSICTKVKVQYSSREDFSIIIGEKVIIDWKDFEGMTGVNFLLNKLIQGRRYFFRASSGNLKGFGPFKSCNPKSIVPSSWRDISESDNDTRKTDQKETFEKIFNFIQMSKRDNHQDDSAPRRNSKKKTTAIKQLFTAASKFQKSLKRGIHLACICYTEDKVLVTNEDFLPVIEIDDSYPNSLNNDFYWLMKVR